MANLQLSKISPEKFSPLPASQKRTNEIVRPTVTYWQDAWRRLKENKMAMLGLYTIIFIILLAIFGPMFSKFSYSDQFLDKQGLPPNSEFWFGTDTLGRDMFVRVLYGARISLAVGFVASFINLTLGVLYGGISGLVGGRIDNIMMRIVDIFYSVPLVLYVILLMVVVGPGLKSIFIALGAVYWLEMARIVRGQVLSLKEQEFVLAARTLGANNVRILLRHLIPNCMGPIIITVTNSIPRAIFTEAFLSFIGLGVSAPMASWGMLASDAVPAIRSYPHILFFPALAISITMLAFNFFGDGLRDALDPRLRK
ncbi:MAG: ABC transporter permease [Bacillota bacterium]|jgi:oligopeptide transport system permease protein|uniref:ABC transporter permease subunit n=1 Tax=Thermanaerosceptrum fracticalcis TaxID=1712410 RepID=A0A7G6E7G5_THEFR|nr:ABC transporter permease [Thermanaerosceptrum fracticalcis]QNB48019.1 ABC transporter permease subunit [Thermanaerosceptrum fracticalcis]